MRKFLEPRAMAVGGRMNIGSSVTMDCPGTSSTNLALCLSGVECDKWFPYLETPSSLEAEGFPWRPVDGQPRQVKTRIDRDPILLLVPCDVAQGGWSFDLIYVTWLASMVQTSNESPIREALACLYTEPSAQASIPSMTENAGGGASDASIFMVDVTTLESFLQCRDSYFNSHPPAYEKYTNMFVWNCALHRASDVVFDCCAHAHVGGVGEEGGTARTWMDIVLAVIAVFGHVSSNNNSTQDSYSPNARDINGTTLLAGGKQKADKDTSNVNINNSNKGNGIENKGILSQKEENGDNHYYGNNPEEIKNIQHGTSENLIGYELIVNCNEYEESKPDARDEVKMYGNKKATGQKPSRKYYDYEPISKSQMYGDNGPTEQQPSRKYYDYEPISKSQMYGDNGPTEQQPSRKYYDYEPISKSQMYGDNGPTEQQPSRKYYDYEPISKSQMYGDNGPTEQQPSRKYYDYEPISKSQMYGDNGPTEQQPSRKYYDYEPISKSQMYGDNGPTEQQPSRKYYDYEPISKSQMYGDNGPTEQQPSRKYYDYEPISKSQMYGDNGPTEQQPSRKYYDYEPISKSQMYGDNGPTEQQPSRKYYDYEPISKSQMYGDNGPTEQQPSRKYYDYEPISKSQMYGDNGPTEQQPSRKYYDYEPISKSQMYGDNGPTEQQPSRKYYDYEPISKSQMELEPASDGKNLENISLAWSSQCKYLGASNERENMMRVQGYVLLYPESSPRVLVMLPYRRYIRLNPEKKEARNKSALYLSSALAPAAPTTPSPYCLDRSRSMFSEAVRDALTSVVNSLLPIGSLGSQ
uniref:Uncharacterized protein n=1 Tax=Timema douglasi TaxID=61478 RepID=A0A7R8ZC13_TIMDO|nr:unnamed protein product [Timema douglasi]